MPTVLIAEDNEASRDALARRLERRNYTVLVAVDGQQAVSIARSTKPDLILMDLGNDRHQALAAGCDDFDTKPVEFLRLIEKIEMLLTRAGR